MDSNENDNLVKVVLKGFADLKAHFNMQTAQIETNKEGLAEANRKIQQNIDDGKRRDERIDYLEGLVKDNRRRNARRYVVKSFLNFMI